MQHDLRIAPDALGTRFRDVRRRTEALASPLSPEDQQAQSMPDASPTKWHLAHTTWFFDTFVLAPRKESRARDGWGMLFNSYYDAIGPRSERPERGLVTRPALEDVRAWRSAVDEAVASVIEAGPRDEREAFVLLLGTHHEEQHQELLLTDVLHLFSRNPLAPAYARLAQGGARSAVGDAAAVPPLAWRSFEGGLVEVGDAGASPFAFDNEGPRHRVWLEPFEIASRLVSNGEYLDFLEDGGYRRPELWTDAGFAAARAGGWEAPLYWRQAGGRWHEEDLHGLAPLERARPVAHVSWYEADAYARWAGARLAREEEWEIAAAGAPAGSFLDGERFAPAPALAPLAPGAADGGGAVLRQMTGELWQWTASDYAPYPGFRPFDGALGEYNGKFMVNQRVLRGGSFATPRAHHRDTYRNFFPPEARWQFAGIRLAREPR